MRRRRWPKGTWMKLASSDMLKVTMERRRCSHEQLARWAGCSRGFISHLTSGRKTSCTPDLAERIAEALDVDLSLLFVPKVEPVRGERTNRQGRKVA